MNLPNQAMPIVRGGQSSFNSNIGISASGCGTGKHCCEGITGKHCRKCALRGIFGECLEPAAVTCAAHLEVPSGGC